MAGNAVRRFFTVGRLNKFSGKIMKRNAHSDKFLIKLSAKTIVIENEKRME